MLPSRFPPLALVIFAMTACAPTLPEEDTQPDEMSDPEAPPLLEECDAADYRPLIGTNIAAVTLPADDMIRVYSTGDIITQEYIPQRTNIVYDSQGVIQRAYCG